MKALVTGASSGIGAATAKHLASDGHDIIICFGENKAAADDLALEISTTHKVNVWVEQLKLAEPTEVQSRIDEIFTDHRDTQLLINNAGVNPRARFVEESLECWQTTINTNLTGPFLVAQAFVRNVLQSRNSGRVINVTSVHETIPISQGSTYCTTKAGLGMLTKTMALELGEYGINVNSVAPGETATPMNGYYGEVPIAEIVRPVVPVRRPGAAEEIAGLIAYLCSPLAEYITGQSFIIDGGLTLIAADANVRSVVGS